MTKEIDNSICPANKKEWRKWLQKNHIVKDSIWLIIHKKNAATPTISWSDAVDEALCFGWIDSVKKSIDAERYMQYYSKRKTATTWSKINKDKVMVLIEQGLMAEAGYKSIEIAKQNGSWTILDEVENLVVPDDLAIMLKSHSGAEDYFMRLSNSVRKHMLAWVALAKRPETREKRIIEIAEAAGQQQKPKAFS